MSSVVGNELIEWFCDGSGGEKMVAWGGTVCAFFYVFVQVCVCV